MLLKAVGQRPGLRASLCPITFRAMTFCMRLAIAPARSVAAMIFSKPGTTVSEMLDYVPASFRVLHHVQPRLVCKGCDTEVKVAMPSPPIERGNPSPGLIAHVLTAKYCDHPLAIDGAGLQANGFRYAQAGGVTGGQYDAMFSAATHPRKCTTSSGLRTMAVSAVCWEVGERPQTSTPS